MFDMIAILGRGIQRLNENAPLEDIDSWVLTEDFEVCDVNSAHLPVRDTPADDNDPLCMIGGGEMNLAAGIQLMRIYQPSLKLAVCAYGGRSKYLEAVGGPTESEVMSDRLVKTIGNDFFPPGSPGVVVWERRHQLPVPANTRQELLNIFDLAVRSGLKTIAIVTVGVHVPRTAAYVAKHLSVIPSFRGLAPIVLESEEILLAADYKKYAERVDEMRGSESFQRNWKNEAIGIQKLVRDVYGDTKPLVAV